MYFPSKKDLWLSIIIWGTIGVCIIMPVIDREPFAFFIGLPVALFMAWLWFTTGYTIEEKRLVIRYGPFKKVVMIAEISKINKVKNPMSAPALSMDRLKITYGKLFGFAVISPINQNKFVQVLVQKNPNIQLDDRLKEMLKIKID
ncbi:PH domain-containing protein [Halalkalibacterium ligniniphilum]|uniref:PH domain-containing protein n=1 Tax=Halalkalibacterium ligniniphilum TaxID=1134413 RepID=UPI000348D8AC|nr:PH domain-containing protein [Halalkalibacterium ligniniphilum]